MSLLLLLTGYDWYDPTPNVWWEDYQVFEDEELLAWWVNEFVSDLVVEGR